MCETSIGVDPCVHCLVSVSLVIRFPLYRQQEKHCTWRFLRIRTVVHRQQRSICPSCWETSALIYPC